VIECVGIGVASLRLAYSRSAASASAQGQTLRVWPVNGFALAGYELAYLYEHGQRFVVVLKCKRLSCPTVDDRGKEDEG
jgi:hypothetical protein